MDNGISSGAPHCCNCGQLFKRNPRLGDRPQRYCENDACQKARRAAWHQQRYATSVPFREAVKKRVRIGRRAQGAANEDDEPAGESGPEPAPVILQLQAQLQEMGLLFTGMASHNTGIVDGVALAICLERYAERGRRLQQKQA